MAQPDPGIAGAAGVPPPAAGAAPPAVVAPTQPRNYRELYADAANNVAQERTAVYLRGYRFVDVAGGVIPTPAALRDQTVVLSDRQPMAFLALTTGLGGVPEVVIIH